MQLSELVALENDEFYSILFEAQLGEKKRPLKPSQIVGIYKKLCEQKNLRDLVLFTLGIDIMYRCSDILKTKVKFVQDSTGEIIKYLSTQQQKTKTPSCSTVMEATRCLLKVWIEQNDLKPDDYLFQGRYKGTHLGDRRHRDIVKEWVSLIDLPQEFYSTHTMRRTKSIIMYMVSKDPAAIRHVLGQKSLASTQAYLGVEEAHALHLSGQFDFFDTAELVKHGLIDSVEL